MASLHERISAAGVGLAGVDGCWWLPAAAPFSLPAALEYELNEFAAATFALLDVVGELYGAPEGAAAGLDALLEYKLPASIPRLAAPGPVLAVRPDFQLRPIGGAARFQLAATELEICPSAQGFAHAMQRAYGLETNLAAAYARVLAGRELLIVASAQWGEFVWDQLAFCRALAEQGARGRVLLDVPLAELAARVRRGECWQPPMFGIPTRPPDWDGDILARVRRHGFGEFVYPNDGEWPGDIGGALVFRFGYLECWGAAHIARMCQWQARGATFLNPPAFYLDSKAVLAALGLPAVRQAIELHTPGALGALDRGIPETLLVRPAELARLRAERADWVIKYAGFDQGNQAWGGRSLQLGAQHTPDAWARRLEACLELGWPVVAQRIAPSARLDIAYLGGNGRRQWLREGSTRLRSFFLRGPNATRALVAGTHLTAVGGATRVAEAADAVQAPVVFAEV